MNAIQKLRDIQDDIQPRNLRTPVGMMLLLWAASVLQWVATGNTDLLLLLLYIGVFIGLGLGLFLALPDRKKAIGRKTMMLLLGSLLLYIALTSDHGNMQIEGLFFALIAITAPYILLHYALAKIVGPVLFGRVWCGWACWYGMVFDLLPYPHSRYRLPARWSHLRYVHFFVSLIIIAGLWLGLRYNNGALGATGLIWFVVGVLLYYISGIALAFALKDNRAFCKYLCPIAVPLKASSRFALLKVSGTPENCGECQVCTEMCPMNIRVRDYIVQNERVLSTECTLCQTCIHVCPYDSLTLSFKFDLGGKEHLDYDPSAGNRDYRSEHSTQ